MRIGQIIKIEGIDWALVRTNAGHSGCADLLRPHRGGKMQFQTKGERLAFESVIRRATDRLAIQRVAFLRAASAVRCHVDPYWLTLEELSRDQEAEEKAIAMGVALQRETAALRRYASVKAMSKKTATLLKELGYQVAHTKTWRQTQLGEQPWMTSSI
jgi:hypothetical protein